MALSLTCFALALTGPGTASARGPDALVEAGRELYLTGCSSCHGVDGRRRPHRRHRRGSGRRGRGRRLRAGRAPWPSLENAGAAGAYYYLATGRMPLANPDDQPRRKEPAYDPAEIAAIVAYVASLGKGPPLPDVDLTDTDVAAGGVVFRANCQACHSAFGSGGALSYGRAAPNLHSAEPLEVGAAVRVGPGQMPAFGPDIISGVALEDLAAYVEFLRSPPSEGGLQIGRNGPVPEGFVIWLFGIGGSAPRGGLDRRPVADPASPAPTTRPRSPTNRRKTRDRRPSPSRLLPGSTRPPGPVMPTRASTPIAPRRPSRWRFALASLAAVGAGRHLLARRPDAARGAVPLAHPRRHRCRDRGLGQVLHARRRGHRGTAPDRLARGRRRGLHC